MMGGQSSKRRDRESPPLPVNANAEFNAELSSYVVACALDPDLKAFDVNLHMRTNNVINSLATGVEVRAMSIDSLKAVTGCLLDMNQEVVKIILESKRDIWNNDDLFDLVEEYFDNSVKTLDFCTVLEKCLKRARSSQMIIQAAVKRFEEEEGLQDGVVEKKYAKTLEELQKFKEAGSPFDVEFFELLQSVQKQQVSMLRKLQQQKKKLDKKMKSMKTWRRVSNVLFVTAFVSVLIFSVVAASVAAPPVVTALAGALAVPIGSIGKWCNMLWNKYEKELKAQRDLVSPMWIVTSITIMDLDNIRALVNKMEVEIEPLVQSANIAVVEEDHALKLVVDEIKKKLEVFMETIEVLSAHAGECHREVTQARTVILNRIKKFPDH